MPVSIGTVDRVKSITANYTALISDDLILADSTSGAITITLPTAASFKGKEITIIKTNTGLNKVTVGTNFLFIQNDSIKFVSNGIAWYIVNYNSAKVFAHYGMQAVAQTLADASPQFIGFETKITDTHNIVSGSDVTWRGTIPKPGICTVNVGLSLGSSAGWGAAEYLRLYIYLNGVATFITDYIVTGAGTYIWKGRISGTMSVQATDYITIQAYQNSGGALTMAAGSSFSYVTIEVS